jgi:hypothetical protein
LRRFKLHNKLYRAAIDRIWGVLCSWPGLHFRSDFSDFCRHSFGDLLTREPVIAKSKSPTTFAKRQREQDKRRKANDKLAKRSRRKEDNERNRDAPASDNPSLDETID